MSQCLTTNLKKTDTLLRVSANGAVSSTGTVTHTTDGIHKVWFLYFLLDTSNIWLFLLKTVLYNIYINKLQLVKKGILHSIIPRLMLDINITIFFY